MIFGRKKTKTKRVLAWLLSGATFLFLYAPIAVVFLFSFNTSRRNILFEGFTIDWYVRLLENRSLIESFWNMMIIACSATLISTVLGTLAAIAMFRYKFRGKSLIDSLLYIPVVIPEVVLGIALLSMFSLISMPLSLGSMIVAHTTFCIPFVVFTVRARLSGFDRSIEEAAMDLGANRIKVLTGITLPIIAPGIVAGAILAFTLSIDDVIISFFTSGPKSTTLPLFIMNSQRMGIEPSVYALSSIIILVTFVLVLASQIAALRSAKKGKNK
jgi:spermidine/putrescine transport system permease protein